MNYAQITLYFLSRFEPNLKNKVMKKVLSLWVILLTLVVIQFSCSKEEDNIVVPVVTPSIAGKWEFSKWGNVEADGTISNLEEYRHGCTSAKDNWNLTKEGDLTVQEYLNCDDAPGQSNYTYTYQNKILSYTNENSVASFTVVSLTATQLKVKSQNSRDRGYNYYEFQRKLN